MARTRIRAAAAALLVIASTWTPLAFAQAQARNFAPGFSAPAVGAKVVVLPVDMELFSLSGGGVLEPRADWTAAAQENFRTALASRKEIAAHNLRHLKESDVDELGQLNALHGTVAEAVFVHHMNKMPALPTKNDTLDWTLGEAVKPLQERTQADYALFFWVRDSYASAERKAAMVGMVVVGALLGVAIIPSGGQQIGYASLVDLKDGRIVWFNNVVRGQGDLRESKSAEETVEALLRTFPAQK
jgi:hypothetical protein